MTTKKPTAALAVWGLVLLLLILHQDNWFWTNDTLVFGIMPIGLFYHSCISLAAGATWFLATKFAWPADELGGKSDGGAS